MKLKVSLIALWAGLAGLAHGEPDAAAPPAPKRVVSALYLAVTALSDYRFDGFSESNRAPTWQVTIHDWRSDGLYAGAQFTGVNFLDVPRTHFEANLYAGKHIAIARADLNLELLYTTYPDKRAPGPSYDMGQIEAELSRPVGRFTLKEFAAWSPHYGSGAGRAWHIKQGAALKLAPWLDASASIGQLWIERGQNRLHWDIGATAHWRRLSFDLRYGGTNLARAQCFYTDWCEPGASAALTYQLSP